jgi:bifunctional polynucleotide phosphatase/kinase
VITTTSGNVMPRDSRDWRFLWPEVPKKIKEQVETAGDRALVLIFSNQFRLNKSIVELAGFKVKIEAVISKLGIREVPVVACFSMARDVNRKPCTGMWQLVEREYLKPAGACIEREASCFVGDAAGRTAAWKPGKPEDWSSADRKFAVNLGLPFFTPEEFFLSEPRCDEYALGRDPRKYLCKHFGVDVGSLVERSSADGVEMVIVVGSPASGKSTLYQRYFASKGYVHVNRDALKTMTKCVALAKASFAARKSVFIDNTNPSRKARTDFIRLAAEAGVKIRGLLMGADEMLCRHLDAFRSIKVGCEPLSEMAFRTYQASYQRPEPEEGMGSVTEVPFVPCFDTDEDRELFSRYLF